MIQDIRKAPSVVSQKKITVTFVEDEPLDKASFTARVSELSNRLNYAKENLSAKERFLRAVRRARHTK